MHMNTHEQVPEPNVRTRQLLPGVLLAMQSDNNLSHGSICTVGSMPCDGSKGPGTCDNSESESESAPSDIEVVDNDLYGDVSSNGEGEMESINHEHLITPKISDTEADSESEIFGFFLNRPGRNFILFTPG